jgi:hypothetical protein
MNKIEFYTKDNRYKIIITKTKKVYSVSKYTQYNINISFYDDMDNIVDSINTSEYNILSIINELQYFYTNIEEMIISFDREALYSHYFIIASMNEDYNIYDSASISLYKQSIDGNALTLYFEFPIIELKDLINILYSILKDIEYMNEMNNEVMNNFIKDYYY